MNSPYHQSDNSIEHDASNNILKKGVFRNLFFYVIKGIAMYAARARRLGVKHEQVDQFIALALSHLTSNNKVDLSDLKSLLDTALQVRELAKQSYAAACAKSGQKPEKLGGPATMEIFTDESTIGAQARGLSARKLSDDKNRQDFYWEGVCVERLSTMGALVVSAPTTDIERDKYDICDFIHRHLDALAEDLSTFELMALADEIEKEQLRVVNALIAGDTLVNIRSRQKDSKPPMA